MKNNKVNAIACIAAALCLFLAALIFLAGDGESSLAVVYMCLGASMLCCGAAWRNKSINPKEGEGKDKGEQDGGE